MKKITRIASLAVALIGGIVLLNQANAAKNADVSLTISTGGSYCTYGTALNFGSSSVASAAIGFTGQFLSQSGLSWTCWNNDGTTGNVQMTIQLAGSGLVNTTNASTFIASGNVTITTSGMTFLGGLTGSTAALTKTPLNTIQKVLYTSGTAALNVGSVSTAGVALSVTTNANQAPGLYTGTVVIDLPW